jgi:hypothetical protein
MSKRMGADVVLDFTKEDVVESISLAEGASMWPLRRWELKPLAAGLGDHKIVTTLCPGGRAHSS